MIRPTRVKIPFTDQADNSGDNFPVVPRVRKTSNRIMYVKDIPIAKANPIAGEPRLGSAASGTAIRIIMKLVSGIEYLNLKYTFSGVAVMPFFSRITISSFKALIV